MLISQIVDGSDMIQVVARTNGATRVVNGAKSVYSLALDAARSGSGLAALIERKGFGKTVDLDAAYRQGRLHLADQPSRPGASAPHRHRPHASRLGIDPRRHAQEASRRRRGKPDRFHEDVPHGARGRQAQAMAQVGVQPEWFYKGNGTMAVAPGAPLFSPAFAKDGGEEPEIAGIYVIGDDGTPFRVGFALSNEFSDHVTERVNYLFLAHSKLRNASFGPEILVGDLPADIRGTSRILRNGKTLWEKPFLSGEDEHVAHHRQSRAPPLQIHAVPPAGRRARPHVRHGDALLRRRHQDRSRRRVRDRARRISACRCATR